MRPYSWLLCAALLALPVPHAFADPITYTFSGMFSGSLGGTDFTDAPFALTLATDSDGVFAPFPRFPNILTTLNAPLGFTINGVSGAFANPFHVFRNRFGPNSSVGLSPESGDDLFSITDLSLATYDLKTEFGPLTQSPPDFLNFGEAYATSAGDLVLANDPNAVVTFQARLLPTAVPEPGPMVMLVATLPFAAGLIHRRRTRCAPRF